MKRLVPLMALMVVLVSLVGASVAYAAEGNNPQTWQLDEAMGPVVDTELVMERYLAFDDGKMQSGSVTLPAMDCKVWLADEAAASNVTFANGVWDAYLCFPYAEGIDPDIDVMVGSWNSGTGFTPFSVMAPNAEMNLNDGGTYTYHMEFAIQDGAATVAMGDYLALKVCNNDGIDRTLLTDGCSRLNSPCSDPGYPTPEISTIVLLSLGVLGLAGFAVIRRRRTGATLAA